MSRLLDKLRHAARSHGERATNGKPNELLSRALLRAQAEREAQRSAPAPKPPDTVAATMESTEPVETTGPKTPHGSGFLVALIAMAAAIAAAAFWNHSEPPHQPAVFKLEHTLDLNRTGASGQSSLPGPVPSK